MNSFKSLVISPILLGALMSAASAADVKTDTAKRVVPPPTIQSIAKLQWLDEQAVFYIDFENGREDLVRSKLHPSLASVHPNGVKLMVARIHDDRVQSSKVNWSSNPVILKNASLPSGSSSPDKTQPESPTIAIYALMQWTMKDDKPAIYEETAIEDGKKVRKIWNYSRTRLDLWIREQGKWYIIPQEMMSFDAALENIKDVSELTSIATLQKVK